MSLRWRLMLSVGAVVLMSLAAVAYISSRVVRVELNQLAFAPGGMLPRAREAAAREIATHYATRRLEGMDAVLAKVRDTHFRRSELLLLDRERRLLATSAPLGEDVKIDEGPGGATRIRFGGSELLVRGAAIDIVLTGGHPVGSLLLTPRWSERRRDPMRAVNRWLLLAVAGVGAAALAFTALVAQRIIAPIERLQEATGRIRGQTLARDVFEQVPVTSRDEVGQLAEAFNAMTERLQQHERMRRNMVNDVAHELRTPLTNLRASIESIQDGLRAPDASVIDALHEDVLILQRLVEDLQTLALAEAGKLPLRVERIDVQEELARLARTDPRVHVTVAPDAMLATVDRVRFQQIVSNLVRNALAHTGPDGRVSIATTRHGDARVHVSVSDDGAGICADDLPHIFDRFYRADASRTRTTGGAGLGLAIVRNLVELHGGTVTVESEEGKGTRFTVDLPA